MFGKRKKPEDIKADVIETETIDEGEIKKEIEKAEEEKKAKEMPKPEAPVEPTEKVTEEEKEPIDDAIEKEEKKEEIKLTPEEQKTQDMIIEFQKKYGSIFTHEDFARIQLNPIICNLLIAIYSEIKELREEIKK